MPFARNPRPVTAIPMPGEPEVKGYTSFQLAKHIGINRSTLVRLEQRGVIPKPKRMAGHPVNGRFYDEGEKIAITNTVNHYLDKQLESRVQVAPHQNLINRPLVDHDPL